MKINQDVLVLVGEDFMPGTILAVGKNCYRVIYTDDYGYDEVDIFNKSKVSPR